MRAVVTDGQLRQLRMGVIFRRSSHRRLDGLVGPTTSRADVTAVPEPNAFGIEGRVRAGRRPASSFTLRRVQFFQLGARYA